MRWRVFAGGAAAVSAAAACQAILGIEDGVPWGGLPDGEVPDSSSPVTTLPDGAPLIYHDIANPSYWSSFDLRRVFPQAGGGGWAGGTFDGQHLFLAPYGDGQLGTVIRFDTIVEFTDAGAWTAFDLQKLNSYGAGYFGATFARDRVYFVPYYRTFSAVSRAYNATVAILDPSRQLDGGAGVWSFFDTRSLPNMPAGFSGGAFDGRYVYFTPSAGGIATRYDTMSALDAGTSWTTFDLAGISANAYGYTGAIFDGRFLYFVPNAIASGPHGLVARFDTQGTFISNQSWSTFDITTVNASARGFYGGAFDGRYVYFVPSLNNPVNAIVVRYDTMGQFADKATWEPFSLTTVNADAKGFTCAAFDGRYVYLVPNSGGSSGLVVRYDTTATYSEPTSWSTFDVGLLDGGARGFRGGIFDGRYLYLVPMYGPEVLRFDAKVPPSLPAGQSASFL